MTTVLPPTDVAPDGAAPGLVICAKTARETSADLDAGLDALLAYRPAFPSSDLLRAAADLLPSWSTALPWAGEEGPRPRLVIAPGCVAVEAPDLARRERTAERAVKARRRDADLRAAYLLAGEDVPERTSTREVTGWSRKSRANMVRALCELDYSVMLDGSGVPAMVTLTYPGDWLTVAPNGKAVKAHVRALQLRWRRAWGAPLVGVWKLEFQRRGAPHLHILCVPPHGTARAARGAVAVQFRQWLSLTWAAVVAHPDPAERARHVRAGTGVDFAEGLRARDPKRVAVYFTKHGAYEAKSYQNVVPLAWREPGQGPGRFWGYWGLSRTVVQVELDVAAVVHVSRILRRLSRAQGVTRQVSVPRQRVDTSTGAVVGVSSRRCRRRVSRFGGQGRGWLSVNDGADVASQLARALRARHLQVDVEPADRRGRLVAATGATLRHGLDLGGLFAATHPPAPPADVVLP